MAVYITEYIIICFSAGLISHGTSDIALRNKRVCIFLSLILFLALALRHQAIGIDLAYRSEHGYLGSFEHIGALSMGELIRLDGFKNYEPGFIIYNWIVYSLFPNRQVYMAITAALSILPVSYVINKYSKNTFLALLIYAALPSYMMLFSGLRQGLAIGLCFYATVFITEKKLWKFLLSVFIATQFHYSAFIFYIAYPLCHIHFSQKACRVMIFLLPIIYIFRGFLFHILSSVFKDNARVEETGAFMLMVLFMMLFAYMVLFGKAKENDRHAIILFYIACICSVFSGLHNLANRVGFYFMPYLALCLPNITNGISNKKEKLIMNAVFGVLFVCFAIKSLYGTGMKGVSEYMFFWE